MHVWYVHFRRHANCVGKKHKRVKSCTTYDSERSFTTSQRTCAKGAGVCPDFHPEVGCTKNKNAVTSEVMGANTKQFFFNIVHAIQRKTAALLVHNYTKQTEC